MKGGFNKKMNGGGDFSTLEMVMLCIGLLLLVAIMGAIMWYFIFRKHPKNKQQPSPSSGPTMEHFASGGEVNLTPNGDETVVALYSADWCPHCQDYKPMWGKMKGSGVATTKSGRRVRFVDVDSTDGAHPSSKEYGVEGYPTVIAISASGHKQLSRPTTMEELEAAL
jgi:thiol-disulfide isomerase/thioredoxin